MSNGVTVHESAGLCTHAERDGGQGSHIWPIGVCPCDVGMCISTLFHNQPVGGLLE